MRANVRINPVTLQCWEPKAGEGCEIAGVPGRDEPGIEVEMPLESEDGGLPTGRAKDTVKLEDGTEVSSPNFLTRFERPRLTRNRSADLCINYQLRITQHFRSSFFTPLRPSPLTPSKSPHSIRL